MQFLMASQKVFDHVMLFHNRSSQAFDKVDSESLVVYIE